MSDFKIITISGMLGSGKSTVAKLLAECLGWDYYSTGNAQREIAAKRGMTTLELNRLADTDPSIDKEIDGVFIKIFKDAINFLIDGGVRIGQPI